MYVLFAGYFKIIICAFACAFQKVNSTIRLQQIVCFSCECGCKIGINLFHISSYPCSYVCVLLHTYFHILVCAQSLLSFLLVSYCSSCVMESDTLCDRCFESSIFAQVHSWCGCDVGNSAKCSQFYRTAWTIIIKGMYYINKGERGNQKIWKIIKSKGATKDW